MHEDFTPMVILMALTADGDTDLIEANGACMFASHAISRKGFQWKPPCGSRRRAGPFFASAAVLYEQIMTAINSTGAASTCEV